MILNF